MLQICFRCASDVLEICLKYAPNMQYNIGAIFRKVSETCSKNASVMIKQCSRYASDVLEICLKYAPNMQYNIVTMFRKVSEICSKNASGMIKLCSRYASDVLEICLKYAPNMQYNIGAIFRGCMFTFIIFPASLEKTLLPDFVTCLFSCVFPS
jgi:DNA-binding XRE family transcriptional regulator